MVAAKMPMFIWAGQAGQPAVLPLDTHLQRLLLYQAVSGPIPAWSRSVLQESGSDLMSCSPNEQYYGHLIIWQTQETSPQLL